MQAKKLVIGIINTIFMLINRYPFVCNEILSSAEAGVLEAFFDEGESSSDEEDS